MRYDAPADADSFVRWICITQHSSFIDFAGACRMDSFDFQPRTRIVFGAGRLNSLGELASELGAQRALVVSDPGIVAAGHTARGIAALEEAGIETQLFSDVGENPTTDHVEAGLADRAPLRAASC